MSLVIKAWDLIKSKVQPAFAFALRGQKKKKSGKLFSAWNVLFMQSRD